jgi:iron complex transport system substrate-binding protein
MPTISRRITPVLIAILIHLAGFGPGPAAAREITDMAGREVRVPDTVHHVICSGSGILRLLTYLNAQDRVVAVDDMETRRPQFDARPYALANHRFKTLPVFGGFRGHDHPERILTLDPLPQVIFKARSSTGYDPEELAVKTGIPVVVLNYGDLGRHRPDLYRSLRLMGAVLNQSARAEAVMAFFDARIDDLKKRTRGIPEGQRPGCFVGGIAYRGPHGFQSTEPAYPPFAFVNVRNLACPAGSGSEALAHSSVAKEQIVVWDPDLLFLDLSTLQMGDQAGGWHELKTDPAYRSLRAVQQGRVYGLLPYNWYSRNFGSILANAYYIGKRVYPAAFADIDPAAEADRIYTYLVGRPVFATMNNAFGGMVFQPVPLP